MGYIGEWAGNVKGLRVCVRRLKKSPAAALLYIIYMVQNPTVRGGIRCVCFLCKGSVSVGCQDGGLPMAISRLTLEHLSHFLRKIVNVKGLLKKTLAAPVQDLLGLVVDAVTAG
jgi:hypothetical protein